ncbi:MAG TPA: hypothetical protein VF574_07610 [Allosphingosinicella sp.]
MIGVLVSVLAAPVPAELPYQCLLAGPSYSLLAATLERSTGGDQWTLRQTPGEAWPFSTRSVALKADPGAGPEERVAGHDEATGLWIAVDKGYGADRLSNVMVDRGPTADDALPALVGRCVVGDGPSAQAYRDEARRRAGPPIGAATFAIRKLIAAKECQVISAGGWVSRFTIDYLDEGGITIRPADQRIWPGAVLAGRRSGMPLPPKPLPLLKLAFQITADKPSGHGGIDTLWVYARGEESSARASFFGHVPKETGLKEEMTGICTNFVNQGTVS